MRNQEGIKIELQKKVHRRICVKDITFLTARSPFYVIFVAFFIYSPSIKVHNIVMDGILLDVENMKISCYLILAGWHH